MPIVIKTVNEVPDEVLNRGRGFTGESKYEELYEYMARFKPGPNRPAFTINAPNVKTATLFRQAVRNSKVTGKLIPPGYRVTSRSVPNDPDAKDGEYTVWVIYQKI